MEVLKELKENLANKLLDYQNRPRFNYGELAKDFYINKNSVIIHALKTAREIKRELNEDGLEKMMKFVKLPLPIELDNFIGTYQRELADGKFYYQRCRQLERLLRS